MYCDIKTGKYLTFHKSNIFKVKLTARYPDSQKCLFILTSSTTTHNGKPYFSLFNNWTVALPLSFHKIIFQVRSVLRTELYIFIQSFSNRNVFSLRYCTNVKMGGGGKLEKYGRSDYKNPLYWIIGEIALYNFELFLTPMGKTVSWGDVNKICFDYYAHTVHW